MCGTGNNFEEAESVRSRDLGNWWRITVSAEDSLKWGFHGLRIRVDGLLRSIIERWKSVSETKKKKQLFVSGLEFTRREKVSEYFKKYSLFKI